MRRSVCRSSSSATTSNWRWNEETFFFLVKSRLDLENFSGHTAEAVRQDFYSTLLLSNIESVLIEPTASTLEKESQDLNCAKVVNHAVSYHAIKHRLIDLLYSVILRRWKL